MVIEMGPSGPIFLVGRTPFCSRKTGSRKNAKTLQKLCRNPDAEMQKHTTPYKGVCYCIVNLTLFARSRSNGRKIDDSRFGKKSPVRFQRVLRTLIL
jgi:hypothetical protein